MLRQLFAHWGKMPWEPECRFGGPEFGSQCSPWEAEGVWLKRGPALPHREIEFMAAGVGLAPASTTKALEGYEWKFSLSISYSLFSFQVTKNT